ncbi:MAG: CRTAC1 family protein [Actinomycetota bacterium]|nr:CRTAC1 family protein [Actinomycetota bacterium]
MTGPAAGENSRGVAVADLDGDGRLDVLVANQHGGPTLLHNEARGSASRGFVSLELRGDGRRCNADAIGSRVRLHGVPGSRVTEVQGLTGFSGQSSHRVHVGLGSRPPATVDVAIRWCGGETTRAHVPTGRTTVVRQ